MNRTTIALIILLLIPTVHAVTDYGAFAIRSCYDFESGAPGLNGTDATGQYNLTQLGTLTYSTGKLGNAVSGFASATQRFSTTEDSTYTNAFRSKSNMTFAFWEKSGATGGTIWSDRTTDANGMFTHYNSPNGTFSYAYHDGTAIQSIGFANSFFNDQGWHRVVITQNANGSACSYYDGTFKGCYSSNTVASRNTTFYIGWDSSGGAYPGALDVLVLSNKVWDQAAVDFDYNTGTGKNCSTLIAYAGSSTPVTIALNNTVNGTQWSNTVTFNNITGTITFTYFNITNTGYCVQATGNGTQTNCTSGSGTSTYLNTTITQLITTTTTLTAQTSQGYLNITTKQLFTNNTINTFNATNNRYLNTTTNGNLIVHALNGTNTITIAVPGNYTKTITCTLPSPLSTTACNATGIYDNIFQINATDSYNGNGINTFTITIDNQTLGGTIYTQNTTNGTLNITLLQGYTYNVQFSNPNATYEYLNATLPANATYQKYTFNPLPTPSLDITIRDANDNSLILENITIQIINNNSEQINYTTNGGFFSGPIGLGTYTVKLESANYSQSIYTLTINTGTVYFLTAYLQFAPNTVTMEFVDSISSSVVLPDTAVSQERIVNGNWSVISNKITDITGRTTFRYASDVSYRFTAIKTGYSDKVFTLDPILFTSYTINMIRNTALDFSQDYQSIYIGYTPHLFYDAQQNQVNITFSSPLGTFTNYNYTISYPGGTRNGSGTNIVGQSFTVNFNITGATIYSTVNTTITYDTDIGNPKTYTFQDLIIVNPTDQTLIANQDNTYGLGLLERLLIGTIILIIIAGLSTIGAGPILGLVIGLFIMGLWVRIGFWPWWAAGLSFLIGFVLIAGRTD